MSSDYYVYEWFIVETLEIFYVGKGQKMRRFLTKRNRLFNNIFNKHNCAVRLVKSSLTEQEAFDFEKDRIAEVNPRANFTLGGEGITGYRHSNKSKQAMSKSRKGKPCPWNQGPVSDAHREKMREVRKMQKPPRQRPVVIFNNKGNVVAEFKTVKNMINSKWLREQYKISHLLNSLKTGKQIDGLCVQYI